MPATSTRNKSPPRQTVLLDSRDFLAARIGGHRSHGVPYQRSLPGDTEIRQRGIVKTCGSVTTAAQVSGTSPGGPETQEVHNAPSVGGSEQPEESEAPSQVRAAARGRESPRHQGSR